MTAADDWKKYLKYEKGVTLERPHKGHRGIMFVLTAGCRWYCIICNEHEVKQPSNYLSCGDCDSENMFTTNAILDECDDCGWYGVRALG